MKLLYSPKPKSETSLILPTSESIDCILMAADSRPRFPFPHQRPSLSRFRSFPSRVPPGLEFRRGKGKKDFRGVRCCESLAFPFLSFALPLFLPLSSLCLLPLHHDAVFLHGNLLPRGWGRERSGTVSTSRGTRDAKITSQEEERWQGSSHCRRPLLSGRDRKSVV